MANGNLYLVSVPIGNIKDITLRALEILKDADAIIAEDTRQAGNLIKLLNLPRVRLLSYRDQQHERVFPQILELLSAGKNLALISDRGTPTISDPGYKLVRDLHSVGISVLSVPGANAAIAALSVSGLPTDRFVFLGFLPRTAGKQRKLLQQFATLPATFIIYESPFRVIKLLKLIGEELGNIEIVLAHELTKLNEEIIKGRLEEVMKVMQVKKIKGEWVVLGRSGLTG